MAGEIFISYQRADRATAQRLHALLEQRGVDAWYDALLGAGVDWRQGTAQALEAAPVFVLLFSKASSESPEVAKELAAATLSRKLVIPVRLADIQPSGAFLYELASRNWVDAWQDTDRKLEELADKLALLVKGGPESEKAASSLGAPPASWARKSALGRPAVLAGVAAIGILVAAGLVFALMQSGRGARPGPSDRVAYFGFAAVGTDPAVLRAASTTSDDALKSLNLVRVATAARMEAPSANEKAMLQSATDAGARFAIKGEVRREGDTLKWVARVVDVPTGATVSQLTREGVVADLELGSRQITVRVAGLARCLARYVRDDDAAGTRSSMLVQIGQVCERGAERSISALRELYRNHPTDATSAGLLAVALVWTSANMPVAQRTGALDEAARALQRAEQLAPDAYQTATARVIVAVAHNRPPVLWMPRFEQAMARAPTGNEAELYAVASANAARFLTALGRLADASRYFDLARTADPLAPNWKYYYALGRAAIGQYGSKETLDRLLKADIDPYTWELALMAAIFLDATDPEIVLAATPADAQPAVACYRDLIATLRTSDRNARLAGAQRVDACLTAFDSPHSNIQAQSMLGNLDRAFELADRPDYTGTMVRYWAVLLLPSTRAMRTDPRFLALMEKLGYVDYWKQTRTKPDICAAQQEKAIPLCKELEEVQGMETGDRER